MDHLDHKKALEMLRKVGITESEITQLDRLRRNYAENEVGHAPTDHRDFTFAHWLATHLRELQLYLLYWW
jgi:hypothetical protein